jgi:hypothetical protein
MVKANSQYLERVERAKWLLGNIKHAAMATVNEDGTPHNTPYFFMCSPDLREVYWGSNARPLHSKNIARTGQAFIVLYEANEGGGLYIACEHGRIVAEGAELERALEAHNKRRVQFGKAPIDIGYYQGPTEQRMYVADTTTFWINYGERYDNGQLREDKRFEVTRTDLKRSFD